MNYFTRARSIFILVFLVAFINKSHSQVYYSGNTLGIISSALGINNTSDGSYSFAAGIGNQAKGDYSIAQGYYSRALGNYSASVGVFADANGYVSYAIGNRSKATGNYAYSIGDYAQATGANSYSFGKASVVSGSSSYAFGYYSGGSGNSAFSLGNYSIANSNNSFAIGEYVSTSGLSSYVLGKGVNSSFKLNNNLTNSLMVGFNSNVPTLFVGASSGMGTYGKVGIGNITNPLTTLDVNGKITMRSGAVVNYIAVSDANGTMNWTDPASLGLGTLWQNNLSNIYFNNGFVGIGTSTPQDKLQAGAGSTKLVVGSAQGAGLSYGTSYIGLNAARQAQTWSTNTDGAHNGGAVIYGEINGGISFSTLPNNGGTSDQTGIADATVRGNTRLYIQEQGNIGIGTRTPAAKLDVNGNLKIRTDFTQGEKAIAVVDNVSGLDVCRVMSDGHIYATELTIKLKEEFPDYVFANNYELMPLKELGTYISVNQHLPNVPNAEHIASEGLSVGTMQVKQMEKIEELTLYILELNNYIMKLSKRIELLEAEGNQLKK